MAIEGCGKVAKIILIVINCITALVGICALGLGIWVKFDRDIGATVAMMNQQHVQMGKLLTHLTISSNLWILCGAVAFFLSILGCVGAWKESKLFLSIYACLMGHLIVLTIAIVIVLLAFRGNYEIQVHKALSKSFLSMTKKMKNTNSTVPVNFAFNSIEKNFKCCGIHGTKDYDGVLTKPPQSCFVKINNELLQSTIGCIEKITGFLKKHWPVIVSSQLILITVESIGFILAITACIWREEPRID